MRKFKVLILTDHQKHSVENSLYAFAQAMRNHSLCSQVDIATRASPRNDSFFVEKKSTSINVITVVDGFKFTQDGRFFKTNIKTVHPKNYDLIWLRLPPPLSKSFLDFLANTFTDQIIINDPVGIYETGSKSFLMNFSQLCPPMKICNSIEDIIAFKKHFPIVLKPFREYGGKGIVRIDGPIVWEGKRKMDFEDFAASIRHKKDLEYLGVKFLNRVSEGDKRIIVVNGKIMGASLRLPAAGSWLCNVSMGGSSNHTYANDEEQNIVETINPTLTKMGIVMYGVDTLVGDDGLRILSEINTTSIGGLPQVAKFRGEPLVDEAVTLIWNYFLKNRKNHVVKS